jgi:hypothetical protein
LRLVQLSQVPPLPFSDASLETGVGLGHLQLGRRRQKSLDLGHLRAALHASSQMGSNLFGVLGIAEHMHDHFLLVRVLHDISLANGASSRRIF